MSVKYEELEHNLVKITVEIPAEDVRKAETQVYLKNRNQISMPGFRKGKVPQMLIERTYGKDVFLEDAVNDLVPMAYQNAVDEVEKEHGIKISSYPEISYDQVDMIKGMNIVFTTTAKTDEEALALLEYLGMPFEK